LKVKWSREGFDGIGAKGAFKIWRPAHFAIEFDRLAEAVQAVGARHVIWATVPHVTIAPVAHVASVARSGPARGISRSTPGHGSKMPLSIHQ
jgi:hypothetical protein